LPLWHPAALLATGFGAGFLPRSPGSWASLLALPIAWTIVRLSGVTGLAVATGLAFSLGWWAAATVAKSSDTKDPAAIVIDEVAGQWLVLVPAPLDPLAYALAFLLFRIFDIWKPWPVRWADREAKGGLGIMLDDLLAAIYAVVLLWCLLAIGGASGVRA
jgi:phosphatidylglycerophosphatase A